jgi:hypothetical protein
VTPEEREELRRFAERTEELGLRPGPADLLILFQGWRGLRAHLARIRRCLAAKDNGFTTDPAAGDADR